MGVCLEPAETAMLVMEFMDAGSLLEFLRDFRSPVDARVATAVLCDVAAGMVHIHDAGLLHADLAARNVLLTRRAGRIVAKVSDFGLSRRIDSPNAYLLHPPVRWMAPEALSGERRLTPQTDTYSFGVLMFEVLQRGRPPFEHMPSLDIFTGLVYDNRRLPRPTAVAHPDAMFDMLDRCTDRDPAARPSFATLHRDLLRMAAEFEQPLKPGLRDKYMRPEAFLLWTSAEPSPSAPELPPNPAWGTGSSSASEPFGASTVTSGHALSHLSDLSASTRISVSPGNPGRPGRWVEQTSEQNSEQTSRNVVL
eukprot:TRINITY_DN1412_c1_g2_i1.p1 TRINITY_DN1412_c1_g2~~TRINITY_DN1412_c1_g2_i1.p1  ORF type:complete len:308 (-),score=56.17 TRINITY_DN1412_c1_g2_i1:61-984(-)